jgi:hypothetical protein
VNQQICKRIEEADAAALGPFCLVGAQPLLLGGIERGLCGRRIPRNSEWRIEGGAAALGVLRFVSAFLSGCIGALRAGRVKLAVR